MYCKKNVVSLFVVLSVLVSGMFMACDQLSNSQPKNEIIEAEIVTIESTAQGNKLSWKTSDLPENTERITVEYWAPGIFFLDLFEINDMTITQVLDEYVTAGKDYSYRICCYDSTGNELCRDSVGIKAIGGKGELKVNIEATADGIHLTANKNSDNSKFYLLRRPSDVPENDFNTYEYYELKMNNQDLNFTDKLVAAGSEYRYYIEEQTGKRTQINGAGEKTVGDSIVTYPRYEINTIKATGGSGEFKITKQPVITFDTEDLTIALTKQPEFTLNPDDYEINLFYKSSENNSFYFGCFTSTQTQFKVNNVLPGEWQFDRCTCWFQYDDFTYRYSFYKDDLPGFLQKITVPENSQSQQQQQQQEEEEPFNCTITPTSEGIKFEWSELPEDITNVYLCLELNNSSTEICINDLSMTSFVDKYVTAGTTYECGIFALKQDQSWVTGKSLSVTATNGKGDARITNKPAAIWNSKKQSIVSFTTEPEVSISSDINWRCGFVYKDQTTDNSYCSYSIRPDDTSNDKTIYSEQGSGTWTLWKYTISIETDSYEYTRHCTDLSSLTGIPQTITLVETPPLRLIATPTDSGIKLEWENLPQETKRLRIETTDCNERYGGALFRINNLTDVKTVTDKYVNANKQYSYRIRAIDKNDYYIETTEWITATATGGLGEKTFTATAEEDGIHITAQKSQANTELQFRKVLSSSTSDFWDAINVYSRYCNDGIDFTDIFVSEDTEYTYSICETVGNEGSWNGSEYENADDFIENPRYKKITIRATGGAGTPELSNEPVGNFNEERTQFIFTTAPQITLSDKMYSWNLTVKYNLGQETWGEKDVIDYWNTKEYGNVNLPQNKGTWYLSSYVFFIQIGDIQWYIKGADLSKLSGIPQSFTIE